VEVTAQTAVTDLPSARQMAGQTAGVPAHIQLIEMAVPIWRARAVYAAAELRLPDLLATGPRTAEDLARATGTHAPSLYRLLRALASCGILSESESRRFALTRLGEALESSAPGAAHATILTLGGQWQWQAWAKFRHSLETGEPALGAVFGQRLFDYLVQNPEEGSLFNEAMVGMHGAVGAAVTTAYDFSHFRSLVDLGGGTGALLSAVLKAFPALTGTLFELPETAAQAGRTIEETQLSSRCSVVTGNFFHSVPQGHEAYVLSHVLHDWNDNEAKIILRNCRRAIAPSGRLLIIETVLPSGDTPHHGKLLDLLMLTVTGGQERTAAEFDILLEVAGFKLTRVIPTATHDSIVEAIPA
jgi:hypothetical protein